MSSGYRAQKSGFAAEAQSKIDDNFDVAEARKCLEWIQAITGEKISIEHTEDKKVMTENMFENLKDGFLLCSGFTTGDTSTVADAELTSEFDDLGVKFDLTPGDVMNRPIMTQQVVLCKQNDTCTVVARLINELLPGHQKLDFSKKAFQPSNNPVFKAAKDRERIGIFLDKVAQYGVAETNRFQTDYLYEKNNLVQVCICIRALGMEAQSREGYSGPNIWPKKALENKRAFSEEQMLAGKQVISLQYGTNKGANQAGMNMGKTRMILD